MTTNEYFIESLNEKFLSFRKNTWSVHSWDYFGYDYGFDLFYDELRQLWTLRTDEDSGYGASRFIMETDNTEIVSAMIDCFKPTHYNFRTQRK